MTPDAPVPPAPLPAGLAEPAFDPNAMRVLKERYFAKKADGTVETPSEFLWRVASSIAEPERPYAEQAGRDAGSVVEGVSHAFYDMMARRDFMPNTPCLVNAGRPLSMLSACFVLPVPDSIEGIFYNLKAMALIQKSGGGCVSSDSRVWTTFCGLEPIEVLFNRATADGRPGVPQGKGVAYDVRDLAIRTVSMDASNGATALKDVTHVWKFDVPAESQIVVRTREGTEVQTSAWHPFMVLRGRTFVEVRADELAAGDVILGPDRPDAFWPWTEYRSVAGLEIDEQIGWLIGFTLGNGSFGYVPALRQERLRWFSGAMDVLDRVREILARRGINVGINKDPRGGTHYVTTLTQDFVASMLAACGFAQRGPKDERIRIPEHIAKSPLSVVRAFVAGLMDSDGTVDADGSPSYTTASKEMAHDLAALLSLLGYQPTLRKEPNGRSKLATYTVLLCRLPQVNDLANDIGEFMSSELRRDRLHSESRVQTGLSLPFAVWRDELFELGLVGQRGVENPGPLAEQLSRWSYDANERVRRDDLRAIAQALKSVDAAASELLDNLARRGQEIASVTLATKALPYYDLTVDGWNTYASGRTGLALIHNTGFSFSELRHQGAEVHSTGKDASGPVSFMKVFNAATDSIKQGGVRRGANMGVLRVDHPDVFHFMSCKKELDAENRALWNRFSDTGRYTAAELAHLKQELLQTQINNFNISVGVTDDFMLAVKNDADFALRDPRTREVVKTVKAREIWDAIIEGAWQNGEPGVLFLDHPDVNPLPGLGPIAATNPCVTAETLVAVADGRGHVAIGELARDGKDVPVFTRTSGGGVAVRMMRRPRKTAENVPIFKVTLDDGSTIRATENHAFALRDGGYREVRDLRPGDSLALMTRFKAQDHWWINAGGRAGSRAEHRYIAEFAYDTRIAPGMTVHHRDFDGSNNRPENLAIVSKPQPGALRRNATSWTQERRALYAATHAGEKSAGFSGVADDVLRREALELTRSLGRRFTVGEWAEFARGRALPAQFTGWRRHHLNGGIVGLSKWAARRLGFDAPESADPAVVRQFDAALDAGYDAEIVGQVVFVNKQCEVCSGPFHVPYATREIAYCSHACNAAKTDASAGVRARREPSRGLSFNRQKSRVRDEQVRVYLDVKSTGVEPVAKDDWAEACARLGVSAEISRTSSPFRSFDDLREAASLFNHRVVSVEFDGIEDVYNGTVDETHNFFVGGFESTTSSGKTKFSYVCNRQCGEQFLHGYDSCNLGSINVGHFYDAQTKDVDWNRLGETTALALRFLDNVIDANVYPIDEIRDMVTNNRRVGLGIMGFADLLIQMEIAYGSPEAVAFADKLMEFIQLRAQDTSETLARERGDFPNKHLSIWAEDPRPRRNAALLSIAPTGTISMIAGCSFGCEPYFGMAYTKHVMKDAEGRPQHLYYIVPLFEEVSKDEHFFSEELLGRIEENRGSLKGIAGVPQHWQDVFTVAADVSVEQHIDMLAAFQRNTDNAVSKCVAEGTLIPTDRGLIPIEQMGVAGEGSFGALNGEYHVISHDGTRRRVTGFYNNGRVETVRIRTKNGATLEASRTHQVLTLSGWKTMADLQVGELIVGRFEELSGAGGAPIDTSTYLFRNTATPTRLPEKMSPQLALWLGMMAADGHMVESTGNVGISEKDDAGDVARVFDALCFELFGHQPRVVVDRRTGVRTRYLTSRALARYVADLVGKGAAAKHVPAQVLQGSSAEKQAFLNGVSLDGYVAHDAHRDALVLYAGISGRLADELEAMCRSLGLPACYRGTETKADGYIVHQVRVMDQLQELLEPIERRKKVSSVNPKRLVRLPANVLLKSLPTTHPEYSNLGSLKQRKPQHCAASTLEKLHVPLADPAEYLVKVASIETSVAQTYDIEVEHAHSYVVNGLVSHNTINAPNDDTRENVSRAIFRAYEAGCKGFTYYRDGSRTEQVVTFSKDGDLAGGNRDIAPAVTEATPAVAPVPVLGTKDELDIDALLAKANALLGTEVR